MKESIKKSREQFTKFVNSCDIFTQEFGKVFYLECEDNVQVLDTLGGLDNAIVHNEYSIRGIGFRCTNISDFGPNFTVRAKLRNNSTNTELKKRAFAILNSNRGYLYPWLTVHLWLNNDGSMKCALVARTFDVILNTVNVIDGIYGETIYSHRRNSVGGVSFNYTLKGETDKFARKYELANGIWVPSGLSAEALNQPLSPNEKEVNILKSPSF